MKVHVQAYRSQHFTVGKLETPRFPSQGNGLECTVPLGEWKLWRETGATPREQSLGTAQTAARGGAGKCQGHSTGVRGDRRGHAV